MAKKQPINLENVRIVARFSHDTGIPLIETTVMMEHARKSFAAYENGQPKKEAFHDAAISRIAEEFQCSVLWPGLWPIIQTPAGHTYNLLE